MFWLHSSQFPINILRLHSLLCVQQHFLQFPSTPADLPIGITIIVVTLKEEICGEGGTQESRLRHLGPSRNRGWGSTNWSNLQKPPLRQRMEVDLLEISQQSPFIVLVLFCCLVSAMTGRGAPVEKLEMLPQLKNDDCTNV